MVRRAAERKRQVQRRKSGQEGIELAGIIGREHAGEPVVDAVVDVRARLREGEPMAAAAKRGDRVAQLIRFRLILRVIDDGVGAARQRQRNVERLRLGARADRRGNDDFKRRSEMEAADGGLRFAILGFQDQFYVPVFRRLIQYYGANATSAIASHRLFLRRSSEAVKDKN